jgi:hypothetical protein
MTITECRSCKAPIIWAKTQGGKLMPLDSLPQQRYVLEEREEGTVAIYRPVFVSHFATCPNADQHRRKKEVTA